MSQPERVLIAGPAGDIETLIDRPQAEARGIALVAHPHPLFGGSVDNKVVWALARACTDQGWIALRPNFRGVGATAGVHDHGDGETDDLHAVWAYACERFGLTATVLAGFSFGAHVQTRLAQRLAAEGRPRQRLILVGMATGFVAGGRRYDAGEVARGTLVIHGESDDTVPLANVLDWARPQSLPVTVIPGADHFFHGKLQPIRDLVGTSLAGLVALG